MPMACGFITISSLDTCRNGGLWLQLRIGAQNLVERGPLGFVDLVETVEVNDDDDRIEFFEEKIDALFQLGRVGLGRKGIGAAVVGVLDSKSVEPRAEHRALGLDQP